jgi:hypothetical protein
MTMGSYYFVYVS